MIRSLAILLLASAVAAAETLTIFAAASTTNAVTELAKAYDVARGVKVVGSYAASSALVKQIEQGAPADLLICADQRWMDTAQQKGLIQAATRRDLLGNELVIVAPKGKAFAVRVEPGFAFAAAFAGRLAVGDPASVPAGAYAKQALERLTWWAAVEGRLAPCADARAALRLVELGEADAGIVYRTDAARAAKVEIIAAIPTGLHAPIVYPVALTTDAKPGAADLLAWLGGETAQAVWRRHGFVIAKLVGAPPAPVDAAPAK